MSWFVSGKKTETYLQEYPEIKVCEKLRKVEVTGCSRMLDTEAYYNYLTRELISYFVTFNNTLILDFRLEFINTASTKLLLEMLYDLQKMVDKEGRIEVNWYYEEDDETILETGEIFGNLLKIPFYLKEIL